MQLKQNLIEAAVIANVSGFRNLFWEEDDYVNWEDDTTNWEDESIVPGYLLWSRDTQNWENDTTNWEFN